VKKADRRAALQRRPAGTVGQTFFYTYAVGSYENFSDHANVRRLFAAGVFCSAIRTSHGVVQRRVDLVVALGAQRLVPTRRADRGGDLANWFQQ
jgi:hypothetical protein